MSELWVPGMAGPLDDLIDRVHRRIEQFAADSGIERAFVEIELADGVRYSVEAITADPGYGFVTIRPEQGEDTPAEVIVPIGSIRRIELSRTNDAPSRLGFSVPS